MWYTGKGNIREYIIEMSNLVIRLKALKLEIFESILVHLVLISLPSQFIPFKISYNIQKKKWTLNELITQYVQEEERLRHEISENVHLAFTSWVVSKKWKWTNNKGKQTVEYGASCCKVQKKQD